MQGEYTIQYISPMGFPWNHQLFNFAYHQPMGGFFVNQRLLGPSCCSLGNPWDERYIYLPNLS